jgi:hypothetical protein
MVCCQCPTGKVLNKDNNGCVSTGVPSPSTTAKPTLPPSYEPTPAPSAVPGPTPSGPTPPPTYKPTPLPSYEPTPAPSAVPGPTPSGPTPPPTYKPTPPGPTLFPTNQPTPQPTHDPSAEPTSAPSSSLCKKQHGDEYFQIESTTLIWESNPITTSYKLCCRYDPNNTCDDTHNFYRSDANNQRERICCYCRPLTTWNAGPPPFCT